MRIVGLESYSFEDNVNIVEAYIHLNRELEALNIINELKKKILEKNYYEKIVIACLELMILCYKLLLNEETFRKLD